MGTDELINTAFKLMLYGNSCFGWVLCEPDEQDRFAMIFAEYLREHFYNLTLGEAEAALRRYGHEIETYGKPANLQFFHKCFSPYLDARANARKIERNRPNLDEQPAVRLITHENHESERKAAFERAGGWYEITEIYYQKYLKGDINMGSWPLEMHEALNRAGYLHPEKYLNMLATGKRYLVKLCLDAITGNSNRSFLSFASRNQANIKIEDYRKKLNALNYEEDTPEIRDAAKLYAVRFTFSAFKKAGHKALFYQEK